MTRDAVKVVAGVTLGVHSCLIGAWHSSDPDGIEVEYYDSAAGREIRIVFADADDAARFCNCFPR
jgi:hypothetical protein